jgi:hypothetical protein
MNFDGRQAAVKDPVLAQSANDRFVHRASDLLIDGEVSWPKLQPRRRSGQKARSWQVLSVAKGESR